MNFKNFMVQDLAFHTPKEYIRDGRAARILDAVKSILFLVPIINTILGIALITIAARGEKKGGWSRLATIMIFGENDAHRTPRIVALSLCTLGLGGLLLLPLAIIGTAMKANGRQIPHQPRHSESPSLSSRRMVEVSPDYLL